MKNTDKKIKIAIAVQRFFGTIALSSIATEHNWIGITCLVVTAAASEYINYITPGKNVTPIKITPDEKNS